MLSLGFLTVAPLAIIIGYVIYQRYLHPLSSFPGPCIASLTNFWRFYHEVKGDLPQVVHEWHKRHGHIIRVAPDTIDSNVAEVVDVVYKKGGRHYPKTEFYDGFTAVRPNVFGTRDEEAHTVLRRQLAHGFSQASLVKMEYIFNNQVEALVDKLAERAKAGAAFRLDHVLKYYVQDTNGELSLGTHFGAQAADDPKRLHPLNQHVALGKMAGYIPWSIPYVQNYGAHLPWSYLRTLVKSRLWLAGEASRLADLEFTRMGRTDKDASPESLENNDPDKVNLLTYLVRAKDPETGQLLDRADVTSNAITFLIAGGHSTSATLEILFWYLLHYPEVKRKVQNEIDQALPNQSPDEPVEFLGLEAKLPYLSAVMTECFRISPTFQHPIPRAVPATSANPRFPTVLDDTTIPPGSTISASVYSLHRNPDSWGADAEEFNPDRWFDAETRQKEGLLMHFGAGHRGCLGRNQALIAIWKATVEALRRFDFELANASDQDEKHIQLRVTGFADLAKPLVVKVSNRS